VISISRRLFVAAVSAASMLRGQAQKARLRRKDCYFGLHFDLHPNKDDKALGRDLTEEMIDRLLDRTRPDYVQYDCKGHVGWLGYPSKVGPSAPGIVKDSLAMWRKVTAGRGVGLFVHFSGVWDSHAVEQHPEWARVRPDGKPEPNQTSTFGPYVDLLMIPQLREVVTKYGVDGAWVDGECWATNPDYAKVVEDKFGAPLPRKPAEPRWQEFLEFNREQFRAFVKHYVDDLHRTHPDFQIASNWLYTTYVPEKPTLPVDFVSGDYLGNASMATARLDARYLSAIDKPWDLMAWGFQSARNNPIGVVHKNREHLMQEASVVLAQGGGFQVYYTPTRAGYFDDKLIDTMSALAKFCRDRQAFSHKTEAVPQAGVLFSGHSLYKTSNKLFGGWPGQLTAPARGMLAAMVECHYPIDVIPDWKLRDVMQSYGLIVVPDWADIGYAAASSLLDYVNGGGKLLLAGAQNAARFAAALGVQLQGAASDQTSFVAGGDNIGNLKGLWQDVEAAGAEVIAQRYPSTDTTRDGKVAATIRSVGKGMIGAIYGPAGFAFANTHAPATRAFIQTVVERLWQPSVKVEAPPVVEVVLRRKGTQTILHLSNATNMQVATEYATTDYIPSVGPVKISIQLAKKPSTVKVEPGGQVLTGTWANGVWTGTLPSVHIHSAVVFA
jgi:hypothetical protein